LAAGLAAGPAHGGPPDPALVPGIGTMAPAFGLFQFDSKAASQGKDRAVVQLDEICGMRPGTTRGVLLAFVDASGLADLQLASGWWKKHHKDGVEVLGIITESNPAEFAQAAEKAGIKFPLLDDRLRVVAGRYGVTKAPFSFLLDRDCKVMGFSDRTLTQDSTALADALRALAEGEIGQFGEQP
jgi:hypothetical protein